MFKISENERKTLIAWLIVGLIIFLCVLFINIRHFTKEKTENITTPGTNYINNRSRYYTVKNAINKYYSYKNAKDYDAVLKILSEDYIKNNHIDKETITTYIGESSSYLTFDTGIMCLKSAKNGVYTYVVEGVDVIMNTGEEKYPNYYEVTLDGNTFLFSIMPITESDFGGVCNG